MRSKGRPTVLPSRNFSARGSSFRRMFWEKAPAGSAGTGNVLGGGPRERRRHVGFAPAQGPGAPWGAGGLQDRARTRPRPPKPDPGEAVIQKKPSHGQGQSHQVGSRGVPEAAEAGPPAGEPEVHEKEASGRGPEDHHEDPPPKPRQESQRPPSHQAEEGEAPGHSVHRGRLPQVPGRIFWEFWDQVTKGGALSLSGRPYGTVRFVGTGRSLGLRDGCSETQRGWSPPLSQLWEAGFLPILHPANRTPA